MDGVSRLLARPGLTLAVILLIALSLRLFVALDGVGVQPATDPSDYARHAHSIARGDGYPTTLVAEPGSPTAMRPPALPYLLGAAEALTQSNKIFPRVVEALLGVAVVALMFLVARMLWGIRAGLLAAALTAIFPPLVLLNAVPLSETLFIPLELGALALALYARERDHPNLGLAIATGVTCGLAGLTRQAGVLFVIPVLLAYFTTSWRRRDAVIASLAVVLAAALTVAPWTFRNYQEFDEFIPIALQDGGLFAGTYNAVSAEDEDFPAGWRPPSFVPAFKKFYSQPGTDEAELNDQLAAEGRKYLLDNPLYALRATGLNTLRLAGVGPGSDRSNTSAFIEMGADESVEVLTRISILLLVASALFGAATLAWRRSAPPPFFVWAFPIIIFLVTAPITGALRYRTPLDPFLILLAVAGMLFLLAKRSERSGSTAPAARSPDAGRTAR